MHLNEQASASESQAESAGQAKRAKVDEKSGKDSDESRAKKEGGSGESEECDGDGVTNEREAQVKMLLGAFDVAPCAQPIGRRSPPAFNPARQHPSRPPYLDFSRDTKKGASASLVLTCEISHNLQANQSLSKHCQL
jgi:hypothetical protein